MDDEPVKTVSQSTKDIAFKAELNKEGLENRRLRTKDGTPISYTAEKDRSTKKIVPRVIRESRRSLSDPDIFQSVAFFTEASGLFSKGNSVSSFIAKQEIKQIATEQSEILISQDKQRKGNVQTLMSSFVKFSSPQFDSQQHMEEFSNPLHRGNQARFRRGGGVLPSKSPASSKPLPLPKPPRTKSPDHTSTNRQADEPNLEKELTPLSEHKRCIAFDGEDDDGYLSTKASHVSDNLETIYAQVDKTKKNPYLKNICSNKVVTTKCRRSDSDPTSNISMTSGLNNEILDAHQNVMLPYVDQTENETISDSDDGWDSDEFDDFGSDDEQVSLKNNENFPDEKSKKLYNIAHEILTTEKAYVKRLHLLDKVFYFRLQNECLAHGFITADVLSDIFSNISSIHSFHRDFLLPNLEERMSKWHTEKRIGDILKTLAPFLKLYTAYIANFDKSNETLSMWTKKSPKFSEIIEDVQKSEDCENLTLGHHMLEPIQRVPRYKLLLKDYLNKLPEDSSDYQDTQDALEIISEAAAHANESMKKTERFKKLLELQERIIEDYHLVTAGRQFIREGDLTKLAARHVAHQERTLLLFNDVLLCCGKLHGTNKLKVKVEMDLYGMEIGETDDDVELPNTFRVTSKQKVIDFSASTEEERERWVQCLNNAIGEISQKRDSYRRGTQPNAIKKSELGKKAPAWVRDESVTMCMSCDSLFTLTRRRHHCRACGGIFCNPCSRRKALLEYISKTERICETCHKILVRGVTESFAKRRVDEQRHCDVRKISLDTKVVLSGYLSYKSGKVSDKAWVKRWCVLSDKFVFYCYKAKKDQRADFTLPLPGYIVDKPNMADNLDRQIAFKLHYRNMVVYYFSTDSQETLDRWIHNLSYAVKAELIPEKETEESES